ncbi:zf-HC2 domain-containing protein [Nonomuraea sp. NN258]|uniref:anti-sigma factor family protein n=1 Tax=Nonomuraea antri TaxID=2730852 RepID=UPI0015683DCA|nr:zf-HC2 domain-containing protein [Nonomuraea antri]NRQ32696.1 zf-HC2 domain-containing protein [Nonomuraea antri]
MTGDTHYDLEILAELAEGLLDVGTARQVREHLAVCDPCGELLADLAAVREVLAATPTPAMPMGVALRIDKALAAEAETRGARRGGVGLAETPDWDELMRDSPWEQPVAVPEPVLGSVLEPVRLGVVSDDGTIVPARRRASRGRRWAMPIVAAAASAAVVGTLAVSTGLLASGGGTTSGTTDVKGGGVIAQEPTRSHARVRSYALTDSDYNYSDTALRQPLQGYLAPAPIWGGAAPDMAKVERCVSQVSDRSKLKPFAVDQGQYNGQEALVVVSWKNQAKQQVRLDVVDPFNCKNLRKPSLGRW